MPIRRPSCLWLALGIILAFPGVSAAQFASAYGIEIPQHVESIQSNPAATPRAGLIKPFQIDPRTARARANAFDNDPMAKRIERGQAAADSVELSCQVIDSIGLGLTPENEEVREVACAAGPGFVVKAGTEPAVMNCIVLAKARTPSASATLPECVLAPNLTAVTAVRTLVGPLDSRCTVQAADWLASSPRQDIYEARCGDDRGVVVRTDRLGGNARIQSCVSALRAGIECRMTDARQLALVERERHLQSIRAAGFSCVGMRDRFVGEELGGRHREVVELACANRASGLVAFIPSDQGTSAEVMDCISASARSVACALTSSEEIQQVLTHQIGSFEPTCDVRDFAVGRLADDDRGEHADLTCSDGRVIKVVLPFRREAAATPA